MIRTALEVAKLIFSEGMSIEEYEKVNERRKERMKTWEKHAVASLIKNEQRLIDHGNAVLAEMKNLVEASVKGIADKEAKRIMNNLDTLITVAGKPIETVPLEYEEKKACLTYCGDESCTCDANPHRNGN